MDKKKLAILLGAKKKAWCVDFDGTTIIDCGSEASIDNLFAGDVTIEGYFNCGFTGATYRRFFDKTGGGAVGYYGAGVGSTTKLYYSLYIGGVENIINATNTTPIDLLWHHFAFTFDGASNDRRFVYVDGVSVLSELADTRAITDDAAASLCIGNRPAGDRGFIGKIGWLRISNNVRYTATFTPPQRLVYPTVDVNTLRLFKMNEGTGTTIVDYSSNAQNATLANGSWINV